MRNIRIPWPRTCRLISMILLLFAATPTLPAAARPASSASVSIFYPTTKAAYDAWNSSKSDARPPKTTVFASGTATVGFYFEYDGATAHSTTFTIVIKNSAGTSVVTDGPFTTDHNAALHMEAIDAPTTAFSNGAFTADLLVNRAKVESTSFTVGSTSKVAASVFYTATKGAYDAWNASTSAAPPPPTAKFSAGTSIVAFYFEYTNATPKVTQYKIAIYGPTGSLYTSRGPFAVSYKNGLVMRYVLAPDAKAYPAGPYSASLFLDGKVQHHTTFVVGGQTVSIGILYPATEAAGQAWAKSSTATRPTKTTTFLSGTKVVAFYFEYLNAVPKVTEYTVVVRNHGGQVVVTHGPYVTSYKDGLQISPVQAPVGAWPDGAYRADLVVGGQVLASTFFGVGSRTVKVPVCRQSDVIATCIEPSILRLHVSLPNNMEAEGTGFVIRSDSTGTYLITNKHVVDGGTVKGTTAMSPDGNTTYQALAVVENTAEAGTAGDLAVVKLQPTGLKPLPWADSDKLHVLQKVVSIGYGDAFDLPGPPTATEGAISALGRDLQDGYGPVWIQHQSFINHGNSGGPLLDEKFNVVGVNTLSQKETQGIFFAIPSNLARKTAAQLIAKIGS